MTAGKTNQESYRPDIDGLRAIAVAAVVLFHAYPDLMPGGFVGVDVFFVISGFLITSIILRKLASGNFSILEFYSSRVRRIFPALALVLSASLAFGWVALLSTEYSELGKHVLASVFFFQNFCLRSEAGYFDTASEFKPLMHLWSLAIEEQFYLAYPAILMLAWLPRGRLAVTALFILLGSLGTSIALTTTDTKSAFFLPQCRFWELLVGALLAIASSWRSLGGTSSNAPQKKSRDPWKHVTSVVGFVLIGLSIGSITSHDPFPGWRALLPVSGAALVILSGSRAIINRLLLSSRPAVFVGLISYPLYLWHWPMLSFAYIVESSQPSPFIRLSLVIISCILAILTYRYIEIPIRYGRHTGIKSIGLVITLLSLGGIGYWIRLEKGLPNRDAHIIVSSVKGQASTDAFFQYLTDHFHRCTPESLAEKAPKHLQFTRCFQSKVSGPIDVALIGDSHAEHIFLGIATAMPTKNIAYYIQGGSPQKENRDFTEIYSYALNEKSITDVIIGMHWARMPPWEDEKRLGVFFLSTVRALLDSGKNVWILSDIPSIPFQPLKCLGRRRFASATTCRIPRQAADNRMEYLSRAIKELQKLEPRVRLLDMIKHVCSDWECNVSSGDILLYRDDSHLTVEGSIWLGAALVRDNPGLPH